MNNYMYLNLLLRLFDYYKFLNNLKTKKIRLLRNNVMNGQFMHVKKNTMGGSGILNIKKNRSNSLVQLE